jgi:glutamate/aspartate transport system permease protein
MNLDLSYLDWGIVSSFVLKGLYFSVELTIVSMLGGTVIGPSRGTP